MKCQNWEHLYENPLNGSPIEDNEFTVTFDLLLFKTALQTCGRTNIQTPLTVLVNSIKINKQRFSEVYD